MRILLIAEQAYELRNTERDLVTTASGALAGLVPAGGASRPRGTKAAQGRLGWEDRGADALMQTLERNIPRRDLAEEA